MDVTFFHEERDTGGTKYPRSATLRAHHPETGETLGELRYHPPKRRGGVVAIRDWSAHPGVGSALFDEVERRHRGSRLDYLNVDRKKKGAPEPGDSREYGNPTDWDTHYPGLPEHVNRGISIPLDSWEARKINEGKNPVAEDAEALAQHVQRNIGMHWSATTNKGRTFAEKNVADPRKEIAVMLHARTPQRHQIETRPDVLRHKGVWPFDHYAGDAEVPFKKGTPVQLAGISWRPDTAHPEADEHGWVHHTFDEPKKHTAGLESQDRIVGGRRDRQVSIPEPGPLTMEYARNTEKAPDMGEMYGQHIEPHGRYLTHRDPHGNYGDRFEFGTVAFQNPLHMEMGGTPTEATHWKHRLSEQYGGKRGRELSQAVRDAGHDAIMTHDEYGPSEVVDLTGFQPRTAGARGDLPDDLRIEPGEDHISQTPDRTRSVGVKAYLGDQNVGHLYWYPEFSPMQHQKGEVSSVWVHDDHQRRGIARAMLEHARTIEPRIRHSHALTDEGRAWSQATASRPELHSRIFGPTRGSLDPRLFEGTRLRPEVRQALLERLGASLEPVMGSSWMDDVQVYLSGSEASEWYGNDDLDILVGVDYDRAAEIPAFQGLADDDITAMVNQLFWSSYNDEDWHAPFGGVWHATAFANPSIGRYSIEKIKPYAAYDIKRDEWMVKPPHLPNWSIQDFPEGPELLKEAEAYAELIEAIDKMPEPYRTRQGKALWEHLHAERSRAFSDEGEGWLDSGNAIEKALNEWGLWDKLVQMKYGDAYQKIGAVDGWEHVKGFMDPKDLKRSTPAIIYHEGEDEDAEDMRLNGIHTPIQVRHEKGTSRIMNGHHRHRVAEQEGLSRVPVLVRYREGDDPPNIEQMEPITYAEYHHGPGQTGHFPGWEHLKSLGVRGIPCNTCHGSGEESYGERSWACRNCGGSGTFQAADHWDPPKLPAEQSSAMDNPDFMQYQRQALDLAKHPVPGTHVWRGEVRHKDDISNPTSVGMHWSVKPEQVILGHGSPEENGYTPDHRHVVWQGVVDHPEKQAIPRGHPIWRGRHQSMDSEAEVRFHPGAKVRLNGAYVWEGKPGEHTSVHPRYSERTPAGWAFHPLDHTVKIEHKRRSDNLMQYQNVFPDLFKDAGKNGDLPELDFEHLTPENNPSWGKPEDLNHSLHAYTPEGTHVGEMTWFGDDGMIRDINVEPEYQRRGVATELLRRAREIHPYVHHSTALTDDGRAWRNTVAKVEDYFIRRTAEDDDDYRMQHRPPGRDDETAMPLHDLTRNMPADVYTHPHYYDPTGDPNDYSYADSHAVIRRVRGKPDAKVRIYRSLPAEHAHQGFRPGDWVTLSKDYARQHGMQEDSKHDWPVISTMVKADDLHTHADDLREWGYNGTDVKPGSVAYKGGYHQEVRQRANGEIHPVTRKPRPQGQEMWGSHTLKLSPEDYHRVVHGYMPGEGSETVLKHLGSDVTWHPQVDYPEESWSAENHAHQLLEAQHPEGGHEPGTAPLLGVVVHTKNGKTIDRVKIHPHLDFGDQPRGYHNGFKELHGLSSMKHPSLQREASLFDYFAGV